MHIFVFQISLTTKIPNTSPPPVANGNILSLSSPIPKRKKRSRSKKNRVSSSSSSGDDEADEDDHLDLRRKKKHGRSNSSRASRNLPSKLDKEPLGNNQLSNGTIPNNSTNNNNIIKKDDLFGEVTTVMRADLTDDPGVINPVYTKDEEESYCGIEGKPFGTTNGGTANGTTKRSGGGQRLDVDGCSDDSSRVTVNDNSAASSPRYLETQ